MSETLISKKHVRFLQTLSEAELTELVIMPLLEKMQYRDIRYTHGITERGKDIVFVREDQLAGAQYLAAAVKSKPLTGSVSSSKSIHEVLFQLQQALREPYVLPFNGEAVPIEMAFCITPFPIATTTIESISAQMRDVANRVRFIDGPQLVSLIQRHLPDLLVSLPDPESRYLHHLCSRFLRATPLGSLGESQQSTVHDLFVSSSISRIEIEAAKYVSFANPDDAQLEHLSYLTLFEEQDAVVIADVGSGKTTLMQRLLIEAAKSEYSELAKHELPIFVPLAHFNEADLSSPDTFKVAMDGFLKDQYGLILSKLTFEGARTHLFLFDGFDELVANHEIVIEVAGKLSNKDGCRVILTSRPSRVPNLPNFRFYRLNPFTDENVSEFLHKWFTLSPQLAMEVNDRIKSNSSLSDLCRTPLMLTLYAILSSQGVTDSLPTRRTDVYRTVVEMLLGRWDSVRKIRNSFSADVKQQLLESISLDRQRKQQRRFQELDAKLLATEILTARRGRAYNSTSPDTLFYELIFRSSLIRPTDASNREFEFVHLSFQEYFAACALHRKGTREVRWLLEDEWWRNTLRFYFGISRSLDSVLDTVRAKKTRHGLGLTLLEFLSEADYTDPEGRKKVFKIVGRDLVRSTITENELAICRRLGNDVVEALDALIQDALIARDNAIKKLGVREKLIRAQPKVEWVSNNLFRVLLEINTPRAHQVLSRAASFLSELSSSDLIEVLRLYVRKVPPEGNQQFLLTGLGSLTHRSPPVFETASRSEASALADLVKARMAEAHITKSRREIDALLSKIISHGQSSNNRR
jgi:hypothetical protein